MPHCPECNKEIQSIKELQTDTNGSEHGENPNIGGIMYSCPGCGVILGVGPWRSEYAY